MKLLSVIVAVLFLIPCNPALSQTLPSCSSIAQDADGDGFGWVINPTETRLQEGLAVPHSCVVDESTETTPVLINRETGIEIPLVRQYWNANVDLAGKTLQCERYSFNIQSNRYDLAFSYQRFHHQLPDKKPYFGIWERSNEFTYNRDGEPIRAQQDGRDLNFVWSVVDGVLIDSLRISERNNLDARDYWVELVSVNGGVNNATRFWGESTSSYYQCTDPATNRFVPTGTPGAAGAAVSDFSEASLIFTSVAENPPPASPYRYGADGPNEVADGPEAILSNGIMWDIQNLAYIRIECPLYFEETLGSGENSFFGWRYDDPKDYTLMFLPPMNDSPRSGFLIVDFQHSYSAARAVRWSIANDNTISNSLLGSQDWFELASNDNGNDILRYWQTNGGLRICELEQLQYDSAFDLRPTTQDEYDNWLIKTNVDTSHCTTAENAYPLTVRNNSCLVDANEQNVPTPNEDDCNDASCDGDSGDGGDDLAVTSDESNTIDSTAGVNTAVGNTGDQGDSGDGGGDLAVTSDESNTIDSTAGVNTAVGNTGDQNVSDLPQDSSVSVATANTTSGGGTFSALFILMLAGLVAIQKAIKDAGVRQRLLLPAK